jgi:hypothetical protein
MSMPNIDRNSLVWRISKRSSAGNCVEVAPIGAGMIAIRHSRRPSGEMIVFSASEIEAFAEGVKDGEFDYLYK